MTPPSLDPEKSFSSTWSSEAWEAELARWGEHLARHGVTWTADAETRELVAKLAGASSSQAASAIGMRLAKLANDRLAAAGDARRVMKQIGTATWVLLSPEQRATEERAGHRFELGAERALRTLATIPLTLGAFFATQYVCRRAGVDENVAWIAALVVYVLTARVVRGRWPLQPA